MTAEQRRLIRCTINGMKVELSVDARMPLGDMLRNELRLMSVKRECDGGECGACAVLINGTTVNSCVYLAVWADGKEIITTEGLTGGDSLLSPARCQESRDKPRRYTHK